VDGSSVVSNPNPLEIEIEVNQSNFALVRDAPLSLEHSQAAVAGTRLFRTAARTGRRRDLRHVPGGGRPPT
jgi:hypothetical protein